MPPSVPLSLLISLLVLIILSAFFSGIEIAVFSVSKMRVRAFVERGATGAKTLLRLKNNPQKFLVTISLLNNVVNILIASLITVTVTNTIGSHTVGIATGISTLLLLVFGEIIPKAIFHAHAERLARMFAPLLYGLTYILTPITYVFERLTVSAIKIFGKPSPSATASEIEINTLTQLAVEAGTIEKLEQHIIQRVFKFNDTPVRSVMKPKADVVCLDGTRTLEEAYPEISTAPYSRIPLYEKTPDNIIGVLYVRDILPHLYKKELSVTLKQIMRPPMIVPEQKIIDELFHEFQQKRVHIAIVVNEHGETVGIVTLEDLLEELVGEIDDEYTRQQSLFEHVTDRSLRVYGNTTVEHLNEKFDLNIPVQSYPTLHALLLHEFQKIPQSGDSINIGDLKFTIEKATRKRIITVRIDRAEEKES